MALSRDLYRRPHRREDQRLKEVVVVGNGLARITDGSFQQEIQAAVLGKSIHLQVSDADHDVTADSDELSAEVQVFRRKTPEEIDDELARRVASGELTEAADGGNLKEQIARRLRQLPSPRPKRTPDPGSLWLDGLRRLVRRPARR